MDKSTHLTEDLTYTTVGREKADTRESVEPHATDG